MSRTASFLPEFVTHVPEALDQGRLYVSMSFATAIHLCACGCRSEVVTPFRPGQWRLLFDGTVTLRPSIGNWSLPCRSHYLIDHNRVVWARTWSDDEVRAARRRRRRDRSQPRGMPEGLGRLLGRRDL
jgi:hypothetical protein